MRSRSRMRSWSIPETDDSKRRDVRCRRNLSHRGRTDLDQPATTRPFFRLRRRVNIDAESRSEHGHAAGRDLLPATRVPRPLPDPLRLASLFRPVVMQIQTRLHDVHNRLAGRTRETRIERLDHEGQIDEALERGQRRLDISKLRLSERGAE